MTKAAELAKWGEVTTNGQVSGRRNLMYNGNFQCWQRSTNVTGLGAASGYFTADRWRINLGDASAGRFTMTRTAGDPDGFNYGLVINCTTADTSIAAGEQLRINQRFEGQDLQHLKKGTSGAETTTISFYAKIVGSATDFVVELQDNDNTRSISKIFTFTTDWVRYYWTIPGDTTGALDQDTAMSMTLNFWLHAGSTHTSGTLNTDWNSRTNANVAAGIDSIFASTSNEFYLAGVQWEVGSVATNFEHRSFGEEFDLCLRYYEKSSAYGVAEDSTAGANIYGVVGMAGSASSVGNNDATMIHWQKSKRVAPTLVFYDAAGNSGKLSYAEAGVGRADNIAIRSSNTGVNRSRIGTAGASSLDAGEAVEMLFQYTADSEL
mgnify:FL=1